MVKKWKYALSLYQIKKISLMFKRDCTIVDGAYTSTSISYFPAEILIEVCADAKI
jgi:hypothetical protein